MHSGYYIKWHWIENNDKLQMKNDEKNETKITLVKITVENDEGMTFLSKRAKGQHHHDVRILSKNTSKT